MNAKKLRKLQQTIDACRRRGGIKSSELESLAKELGRVLANRGGEPTYVNPQFPNLHPLSIPHHGTKDLNRFTANNILDQLQEDVDRWEEVVKQER